MEDNYAWIDRNEYPFVSNYIDIAAGRIHYVDEGIGSVLLFVHGNPNWSFGYRKLIKHFKQRYRCIAYDHIGFGLSGKPYSASYLPQFHADNLNELIKRLGLKDVTLIVHDWGGPIGINYAECFPQNIKSIIAFNSWFWSVEDEKVLASFSRFMGTSLAKGLCKYLNFFPKVLMKMDVGDKSRFPDDIHQHYVRPFPSAGSRKGTWVFPKAIIGESNWLNHLWSQRGTLSNIPLMLLWGMKDKAFPPPFIEKWKETFNDHLIKKFSYNGHNAPEEIGDDAILPIEEFLKK